MDNEDNPIYTFDKVAIIMFATTGVLGLLSFIALIGFMLGYLS